MPGKLLKVAQVRFADKPNLNLWHHCEITHKTNAFIYRIENATIDIWNRHGVHHPKRSAHTSCW